MEEFKNDKRKKQQKYEVNESNEELFFDGENYYTAEEFFNPDEDHDPYPNKYAKWMKITISVIVALSLLSYAFAMLPKFFNMASIEFLSISRELSKNEDVQLYKESVVIVKTDSGKGTGFYFSDDGYIMTNNHVVNDEDLITVTFHDGKTYPVEVVSSDAKIDIAILKVDAEELDYPVLEFEENWEQNQPVYIIGNPLYSSFIANKGNILGLTFDQGNPMLIIDAPIYKGNSGSPVINHDGKVVGIIYASTKIDYYGSEKKVGLAIPIEYVKILDYDK